MHGYLNNKIFILDDLLSATECQNLIEFYENTDQSFDYNGTFPMNIDLKDTFLRTVVGKIDSAINSLIEEKIEIDWCQIVKWPCGSGQKLHFDTTSESTVFTSITYLNDGYQGGRTYIKDDIEIVSKIGRTVFFDGNFYLHGVTEVTDNVRYTLPIWYKRKEYSAQVVKW